MGFVLLLLNNFLLYRSHAKVGDFPHSLSLSLGPWSLGFLGGCIMLVIVVKWKLRVSLTAIIFCNIICSWSTVVAFLDHLQVWYLSINFKLMSLIYTHLQILAVINLLLWLIFLFYGSRLVHCTIWLIWLVRFLLWKA